MPYIDDKAFNFPSRKELEIGSAIIKQQVAKSRLEMHDGSATKASKTEWSNIHCKVINLKGIIVYFSFSSH